MNDPFKDLHEMMGGEEPREAEEKSSRGCRHENTVMEGVTSVCTDCGMMMNKELSFEKEWRYYGMMDTKHSSDPNRCNMRRSEDKTIYKDVEKLGFSDKIVSAANVIYEQVTQQRIFRGNTRKGIIFACIFHAYKSNENPQSCERLIEIFEMDRKVALKGLKFVNLNAPKDSSFRNFQISTEHLIREIMQKFHATNHHIEEALNIYQYIQDKSSLLNRSRPQSVACGVVRFYIARKNPDISMEFFRTKIQLSELTISRIVKEIGRILENNPHTFQTLSCTKKAEAIRFFPINNV
jgi:transcription initiation factor TFIIIB Brf1 subunit/transcription initiation factor TFIIB